MSWSEELVCRAPNGDVIATAAPDGDRWRIEMQDRRVFTVEQIVELATIVSPGVAQAIGGEMLRQGMREAARGELVDGPDLEAAFAFADSISDEPEA